jgi:hypothetical protein
VQEAFDLYATGDWTTRRLAEHLKRQGLRSRETPKVPSRPLRLTAIQEMLRNPYYVGIVVYRGKRVPGRHKRLIDPDTSDRVQAALSARSVAGDRPHKHQHYLRGTLYCAICGGRLLYSKHRGNGGVYEYFCCIGRSTRRQGGSCPSRHYSAPEIEKAIADYYRSVHVPRAVRERIWADVQRDADERTVIVAKDIERHKRKIKRLADNQARLVQLSYQGLVSDEVLATEQQRLEAEKQQASGLLDAAELQARDIESALDGALAKTKTPHDTYLASTPLERRLLNQTFFTRILVGEDGRIENAELTPVYGALAAWEPSLGKPGAGGRSANPDPVSRGQGSHNDEMVELTGLEPRSPKCDWRWTRAQRRWMCRELVFPAPRSARRSRRTIVDSRRMYDRPARFSFSGTRVRRLPSPPLRRGCPHILRGCVHGVGVQPAPAHVAGGERAALRQQRAPAGSASCEQAAGRAEHARWGEHLRGAGTVVEHVEEQARSALFL